MCIRDRFKASGKKEASHSSIGGKESIGHQAVCVKSVSYTHLDVYKRQVPLVAEVQSVFLYLACYLWPCGRPVSYTHLREQLTDITGSQTEAAMLVNQIYL